VSVRVERVDLPGIGVRNDVITANGRRVSIVSQRSGERDLALFDADDPDACTGTIPLTDDEAAALAELLGASISRSRLSSLGEETAGLYTSSSIVAIARGSQVIASPTPDERFEHGDVIIAVGTRKGLEALSKLIDRGPS
jgi:TrkA domain protein